MPSTKPGEAFIQRSDIAPTASGPLDGLTFAVKDVIDVADTVTGYGNPDWAARHFPAARHAVAVELLLSSGARCLGKTITDEFAFSLVGENHFYGTPLNPRTPDRVPGGSSAGSASAVAKGEVDFALGTDTAGSIRIPAANCGLYGLRPTWGSITTAGVQSLAPSFDTVGILAREPGVLGQAFRALSGRESRPPPITTALVLKEAWDLADACVSDELAATIDRLQRAGLQVEVVSLSTLGEGELGLDLFAWKRAFSAAQWPEVWSTFGGWLDHAKPRMGPRIAENFALTRTYERSHMAEAIRTRERARARLRAFLHPQWALCLPTTPCPPPLCGQVDYDRTGTGYLARTLCLTAFAGIAGLPQITVPANTAEGLPIGFSLLGAAGMDLVLGSVAEQIFSLSQVS